MPASLKHNILFKTSALFDANRLSEADIVVNQGGTSSGKTYSILQLLIYIAVSQPKVTITIVGESIPNLKKGSYRDIKNIIAESPLIPKYIDKTNESDRIIYFKNGSVIEFTSYETEQSAKNGKRDYLFVNEANGVKWEIFQQLAIRTRKKTFIDYNPSSKFWAHERLIGTDKYTNELSRSVQLIISDHRDNPFLTYEQHVQIENYKDPDMFRVYSRGATGNIIGTVYPDWQRLPDERFFSIVQDRDYFFGLDFGYTNDPMAGVKIWVIGDCVYLHEIMYTPGLSPKQMCGIFKSEGWNGNQIIYCDHDPQVIAELQMAGLLAHPARKGQGSIAAGIRKMKEYSVYYSASSTNLHRERERYIFEKDPKTGELTNIPIDMYNHCFVGDTLVNTINGDVPIRDIKEGDLVLTSKGYKPVLIKWDNGVQQVDKYNITTGSCVYELICTPDHMIKVDSGWKMVKDIMKYDVIFTTHGGIGISIIEKSPAQIERVYDLTVLDAHEYFANGILVHNCLDAARYGVYTRYFKG